MYIQFATERDLAECSHCAAETTLASSRLHSSKLQLVIGACIGCVMVFTMGYVAVVDHGLCSSVRMYVKVSCELPSPLQLLALDNLVVGPTLTSVRHPQEATDSRYISGVFPEKFET